jgi:hypothetical protein
MSDLRRLIESMDRIDEANMGPYDKDFTPGGRIPYEGGVGGGPGGGFGGGGGGRSSGIGAGISSAKPRIQINPGETPAQAVSRAQAELPKPQVWSSGRTGQPKTTATAEPAPLPAPTRPTQSIAQSNQQSAANGMTGRGSQSPIFATGRTSKPDYSQVDKELRTPRDYSPKIKELPGMAANAVKNAKIPDPGTGPTRSGNKRKILPAVLGRTAAELAGGGGGGGGGSSGANAPDNTKPAASDVTLYPSVPQAATPSTNNNQPDADIGIEKQDKIDLPRIEKNPPANSPFTVVKPDAKPVEPPKQPAAAAAQKPKTEPVKPVEQPKPEPVKPTPQPVKPVEQPKPAPEVKPTPQPPAPEVKPVERPADKPVVKPDIKPPAGGSGGGSGSGTGTGTTTGANTGSGGGSGSGTGPGTGSGVGPGSGGGSGGGQSIYDFLKGQNVVKERAAMRSFKQFENFIKQIK